MTTRSLAPELGAVLALAKRSVYAPGSAEEQRMLVVQRARLCEARQRELLERADFRGVPVAAKVRDCALRPDLEGDCVDMAREAIAWQRAQGGSVVFLSGIPGCGKTVALAWACAHYEPTQLARRPPGGTPGRAAKFAYASDLVRLGRAQFGPELAAAQELLSCRLLCLDEAGIEADPNALSEMLIRRIGDEQLTLLATNLSAEQIEERYFGAGTGAGRMQSRLGAQTAGGLRWVFVCEHPDRRLL